MINNAPNNPKKMNSKGELVSKYKQGNYIPVNKDKVIKLNEKGGVYFRSSWEQKVCLYLDLNSNVTKWGCEFMKIPYTMELVDQNGVLKSSSHNYFADFYYEMIRSDGTINRVIMEVKPYNETLEPKVPLSATKKQLETFEYNMKMWQRNLFKWDAAINYCSNRDIKFVILTEKDINRLKN